jgi:spore coat protein A, manganese oxidase
MPEDQKKFSRRKFLKTGALAGGAAVIGLAVGLPAIANLDKSGDLRKQLSLSELPLVSASNLVSQTAVDGATISKWVDPAPTFVGARVDAFKYSNLTIDNQEFQENILPASFYSNLPSPFKNGTFVWGYSVNNGKATVGPHYPAFTIEARQNKTVDVTYTNSLDNTTSQVQKYITVDQTIHWADPQNQMKPNAITGKNPEGPLTPYSGPIPVVTHLHGGEVPSTSDGGPDAWFTKGYTLRGPAWTAGTSQHYTYPNDQEATTLFYHDHVLGATRTNLYAGLVGFYLLRDSYDTGTPGKGLNLPAGPQEIELAIQDKMFDTNGQLLFPDGTGNNADSAITPNQPEDGAGFNGPPPNPNVHPFWIPEFFGDVIVVNGKTWPYLNVEPRRYRLRIVDGANARFFNLRIPGVQIWIIGTDGGLLDKPVPVDTAFIAPGERADVIVDFSAVKGTEIIMTNDAATPYPSGGAGPGADDGPVATSTTFKNTVGQILKFKVGNSITGGKDTSFNPAAAEAVLRGNGDKPKPIIRLADGVGGIAKGIHIDKHRMITLVEIGTEFGPLGPLLNNTKWDGLDITNTPINDYKLVDGRYLSELPQVGSTEQWDIINLTGDAHPIHLHLVQFQIMNRQDFDVDGYTALYESQFNSGVFEPFNGPPNPYNLPNSAGAIGGNPDVTPFLSPSIIPPEKWENGWKDMMKMMPGQVSRIIVRFAPQDTNVNAVKPGKNSYKFDPTVGPGYVWHCHIVDHEDNEMMRPYTPTK